MLFADADGSTPIQDIERIHARFDEKTKIVIGSRAIPSEHTSVAWSWYHTLLERFFNFCVRLFILPGITDTQCGFKMFTAEYALFLFGRQKAERWSFDIKILFIVHKTGLEIVEVPVNWRDAPGSKLNPFIDAIGMFCDIFIFKRRHAHVSPAIFEDFTAKTTKGACGPNRDSPRCNSFVNG